MNRWGSLLRQLGCALAAYAAAAGAVDALRSADTLRGAAMTAAFVVACALAAHFAVDEEDD